MVVNFNVQEERSFHLVVVYLTPNIARVRWVCKLIIIITSSQ